MRVFVVFFLIALVRRAAACEEVAYRILSTSKSAAPPGEHHRFSVRWVSAETWSEFVYEDGCTRCRVAAWRLQEPACSSVCPNASLPLLGLVRDLVEGGQRDEPRLRLYEFPATCASPPWESDPDSAATEEERANYCTTHWVELERTSAPDRVSASD